VVLGTPGGAFPLINDGHGNFTPWENLGGMVQIPGAMLVADFNADGRADLAIAPFNIDTPGGDVLLVMLNLDAGFSSSSYPSAVTGQMVTLPSQSGVAPDLAKVDGDGQCLRQALRVLRNPGNGAFTMGDAYQLPYAAYAHSLATADFDGDGLPDVAVAGYTDFDPTAVGNGAVVLLLGVPDGGFRAAVGVPMAGSRASGLAPFGPAASPHALAIADSNGGGITISGNASKP
jgi:hypothetical protein